MALLDGKVAIITGASKGIGRVLSLTFAREKASVVCAARSADLVRETADLVGKAGGRAIAVTCDAAKEADVKRMIEAGVKAFGKITTLINDAGDRIDRVIAGQAQVRGVSEEAMRKAMMERSPLKRMTEAEDIAEATLFFASDLAKNISGQVLAVNAGEPAG